MALMMNPMFGFDKQTQGNFEKFNEDLKTRVESC